MTFDEYMKLEGSNWSTLRHMQKSPAHYLQNLLQKGKDTAAMKLGRAGHVAILEPDKFMSYCVVWDGGTRRGKEWDAFKAANEGREILTVDEHSTCMAMSAAVRSDAVASRYLTGGVAERVVQWTYGGHKCKGRLDFVADVGAIVDLKTTRDASPDAFGRQVINNSLLGQAAFYVDGFKKETGKLLPYVLVAVESDAPHVAQVYRLTDWQLDMGRNVYRECLQKLTECKRTNSWPGYASGELELTLPRWALPYEDEDISSVGLEFTETH